MTCCNQSCNHGRDCPMRAAKVAPIGKQRSREDLKTMDGGGFVDTESIDQENAGSWLLRFVLIGIVAIVLVAVCGFIAGFLTV